MQSVGQLPSVWPFRFHTCSICVNAREKMFQFKKKSRSMSAKILVAVGNINGSISQVIN